MKNHLEKLLSPLELTEFLSLYEINQPFVIHHGPDELSELRNLPMLASLDSLLKSWPSVISAHLPDVRDEVSSIETTSKDALKLFKNGMGLLFNNANLHSPQLQVWVDALRKELGLSRLTHARSLIYATPDGKGTTAHFDQNINLVLQIHGIKKWTLAPNRSVVNPTVRHTIGQPVDPELMSYLEEEMPNSMPVENISFELKPGSLLFVPRGVWHQTEAEGDALALNFTFSPPTWADLFLSALRSRLETDPHWRETANGVSDFERRFEAEKKLDMLLHGLIQDAPHWQATDVIDAIEEE